MTTRIHLIQRGLIIVGLTLAALVPACRHAGTAAGPNAGGATVDAATGRSPLLTDDDPLVGWFAEGSGLAQRLIPVFKREGTYYSICRGFEVPLKRSAEGLEWDVAPSSMTDTTIGYDPATGARYLAVFDCYASADTAGESGIGAKKPLVPTQRPAWLLDPTADPPQSLESFLGWYEMVWQPGARWEVLKAGDAYVIAYAVHEELRSAQADSYNHPLTPLPHRLGFAGFDQDHPDKITLSYNEHLRRFELCQPRDCQMRAPLARIARPTTTTPARDVPDLVVGIPSWH